jgi:hypothetical protein
MSQIQNPLIPNPFVRGYRNLRVTRLLLIAVYDDCSTVWRSLHPSQANLPDSQIAHFSCRFNKDFALIVEDQEAPAELEAQCPNEGNVGAVIHAVMGDDLDGRPVHVGDLYSREEAQDTIRRLRFETGFYSRAWEISSAHLTEEGERYLAMLADGNIPPSLLFIAFRLPDGPLGVKLIATPWTDANLIDVNGITAAQLRDEFREKGMPDDLACVLEQAAQADVRLLIFDGNAPLLEGLPVHPM